MSHLQIIQQAFVLIGFSAVYLPVSEHNPVAYLQVEAGDDPEGPVWPFQLAYREDMYAALAQQPLPDKGPWQLQITARELLSIAPEHLNAVSECLLTLNRLVSIGGWGLAPDHQLYFSYDLMAARRELNPLLAVRAVRLSCFFIASLLPYIERVNQGEALADSIRALEQEWARQAMLASDR